MLSQSFIEEMKQQLLAKKQQLQQDLAGLSAHTELGTEVDDSSEEVQLDEVNQDLIATMQADLTKINIALAKIDAGNYGTDDEGKAISEQRLRAIPWADKSI